MIINPIEHPHNPPKLNAATKAPSWNEFLTSIYYLIASSGPLNRYELYAKLKVPNATVNVIMKHYLKLLYILINILVRFLIYNMKVLLLLVLAGMVMSNDFDLLD